MELAAAGAPPPLAPIADYSTLPTDVLHDILLRLPADEVCRLRLVCRSWWSLTCGPLFAAAHASRHPHVAVVLHRVGSSSSSKVEAETGEVRAIDLHGNVIKRRRIRIPSMDLGLILSMDSDLLCVAHGWGQASVVDVVSGDVVADDVITEHRRKVNVSRPQCVLGHVPSTGEYKVLRMQDTNWGRGQTCEIMTLGGGGGGGGAAERWRRRPRPPVALSQETCRSMAVVSGLAYFLVGPGREDEPYMAADSIAVFDMATEEWKPETLQGPLSSNRLLHSTDEEEDDEDTVPDYGPVLRRKHFQLARLGESLVVVYCNVEDSSTELWFLEDMEEDTLAPRWSRRYTLQRTPFAGDEPFVYANYFMGFGSLCYHYPLAVLDD